MGHLGVERTLGLIRDRFFWPRMHVSVERFVTKECECLKKKRPQKQTRAPLENIKTTYLFELVSIDFLHLETCKQGFEYILVVMDHYTCFAQAYPTKNKAAKTVADCSMTSSSGLVSPASYIMAWGGSSTTNSWGR